jgi:hypothetical protein
VIRQSRDPRTGIHTNVSYYVPEVFDHIQRVRQIKERYLFRDSGILSPISRHKRTSLSTFRDLHQAIEVPAERPYASDV